MGLRKATIEVVESHWGSKECQWMKYSHTGVAYSVYGGSRDILRLDRVSKGKYSHNRVE